MRVCGRPPFAHAPHPHPSRAPCRYKPACEGTAPTPREQPAVTLWAGSMVVFGGYAVGGRTNDLFVLDLSSWQWSQPATAGTAPSPRQVRASAQQRVHTCMSYQG